MSSTRRGPLHLVMLCTLTLLTACTHSSAVLPKGFEQARSTRAQLEAGLAPRRWAVVIGIDHFDDPTFGALRHASDDAKDLASVLRTGQYGGFDRVITLTAPERTTRSAILFELGRLRNDLRRQDTLVVYYSGHGTLEFSREGTPLAYLVARDTRSSDLWGTGMELGALRTFLSGLKPQRKVMILDCCFSGTGKSRISATTRQQLQQNPAAWDALAMSMDQSEAVLMASTFGGVALEDDSLGHATYTHYLLRALTEDRARSDVNGDGAVTVYEAHDYARAATVERTGRAQIPEGYFRMIGRAEMYLSGEPAPEQAQAAALVYAYGLARQSGATLEVDGRAKGAFPRTVAIDPGRRHITLKDERGRTVADGNLEFAPGEVYSLGSMLDEMLGYRRFFAATVGGALLLQGPAELLWGTGSPRLAVTSGYRVRGGTLRGLSLSFQLGWSPAAVGAGTSEPSSSATFRNVFDAGATLMLRRSLWRLQLGAGWHVSAMYVPALEAAADTLESPQSYLPTQSWLVLPSGPVLWEGFPLNRNLLLTLEARGDFFLGDFATTANQSSNFQGSASLGMEVGF